MKSNTNQNQDAPTEQDWLDQTFDDHGQILGYGDEYRTEVLELIKEEIRSHVDQQIAERVQAEVVKKLESLYHNQAFGKDCSFCTANSYTMLDNIRQLAAFSKEQS